MKRIHLIMWDLWQLEWNEFIYLGENYEKLEWNEFI